MIQQHTSIVDESEPEYILLRATSRCCKQGRWYGPNSKAAAVMKVLSVMVNNCVCLKKKLGLEWQFKYLI